MNETVLMMNDPDLEVYLIRHGETDYNKRGVIQGRGVNSDINERGRAQALAFFQHFGELEFDKVFASTLKRTHQTLQPFINSGYRHQQHLGLDEIDWGIHEGKSSNPDLKSDYKRLITAWRSGDIHARIDGGESPFELQKRQNDFIAEHFKEGRGRYLVCSHGRAMRSLLCTLTGKHLQFMDEFPHQNLSLYHLKRTNGHFSIRRFNYTTHVKNI